MEYRGGEGVGIYLAYSTPQDPHPPHTPENVDLHLTRGWGAAAEARVGCKSTFSVVWEGWGSWGIGGGVGWGGGDLC